MKKVVIAFASFVVLASTLAFTTINKGGEPVSYKLDTKNSKIDWNGSKTEGYHPGQFSLKAGNVTVKDGKITGGTFTVDIESLKVNDGAGATLEGHLKAGNFFDASKFPDAVFEITSVKYSDVTNAEITGNLTLKGAKAEIKFNANVRSLDASKLFAEAFFNLDASKFGFIAAGGKISNNVQIGVHLFAAK
jgi:polyisoprenoid-binding protein YceI